MTIIHPSASNYLHPQQWPDTDEVGDVLWRNADYVNFCRNWDVDFIEIHGPTVIVGDLNRVHYDIGRNFDNRQVLRGEMLITKGPMFLIISQDKKQQLAQCVADHFGVPIKLDDRPKHFVNLPSRRIASYDFVDYLNDIGVRDVKIVQCAMKGSLDSFKWLDRLKRKHPTTTIHLDFGCEEIPTKLVKPFIPLVQVCYAAWNQHLGHFSKRIFPCFFALASSL